MAEEKEIAALLEILKDPGQSEEARQQALQQLSAQQEEVQQLLRQKFRAELPVSEAALAEINSAYHRLQLQLQHTTAQDNVPVKKMTLRAGMMRKWISMAAAVLLCIAGVWLLLRNDHKPAGIAIVTPLAAVPKNSFDTIRNPGGQEYGLRLRDGSDVRLAPNSAISFVNGFSARKKEVFLNGSALFIIKKECTRPFSVFVNGIEVVDLGTVFSVTTKKSLIKVRLERGKVLIRPVDPKWKIQNVILKPGQQFSIDTATQQYAVIDLPRDEVLSDTRLSRKLEFENAPLAEVFKQLSAECGIYIGYPANEIQDMAFTGTFSAGADLRATLQRLCMLNELKYKAGSNAINIYK